MGGVLYHSRNGLVQYKSVVGYMEYISLDIFQFHKLKGEAQHLYWIKDRVPKIELFSIFFM